MTTLGKFLAKIDDSSRSRPCFWHLGVKLHESNPFQLQYNGLVRVIVVQFEESSSSPVREGGEEATDPQNDEEKRKEDGLSITHTEDYK